MSHRFAAPQLFAFCATGFSLGLATVSFAGTPTPLAELKQLSLEELLETRVTSVTRTPVALEDSPSALQVITHQAIRSLGASSLPEALSLASNLDVAQKNNHDWGISARGFNTDLANKLLVMIDGRTIYTPLFSGVRWDAQDYLLEDINQIEVVSGPGGSVWGANAVNGVINITTKSAKDTQGFFGEVGGGNQLKAFSSLRYGAALTPTIHYRIYGKYSERGSEDVASGASAGDGSRFNQGGFRVDADLPAQAHLTFQGDYYLAHEGIPGARDAKIAGGNILTRWSQTMTNGSAMRLQLYYDRTYLHQPFAAGSFGPAGYFSENLGTYDLDFQNTLKPVANHSVIWGLGYRWTDDDTTDAPTLGFIPQDLRQKLISGFAQDQIALGRQLLLTLGTKLEHNDYTGTEIEPSARLQMDVAGNQLLWAAVSRAVRTPSRVDHDIREPSKGQTILAGGKDFESETVWAYETGYRARFTPTLAGTLSAFYNDYRKIRSLSSTPATFLPLFFANDLAGETHGLEITLNSEITKSWRLNAGYTLLRTHLHIRPGGMDLNNALNETSDPQNQVSLGSSFDVGKNADCALQLRWVDELHNNNNSKVGIVPSYIDLNARVGFRLSENIDLSVVGQNLLDRRHPEFGTPGPTRVEIRRSVFAKVAWRY